MDRLRPTTSAICVSQPISVIRSITQDHVPPKNVVYITLRNLPCSFSRKLKKIFLCSMVILFELSSISLPPRGIAAFPWVHIHNDSLLAFPLEG